MNRAKLALSGGCFFCQLSHNCVTAFVLLVLSGCQSMHRAEPLPNDEVATPVPPKQVSSRQYPVALTCDGEPPYLSNIHLWFGFDFNSSQLRLGAPDIKGIEDVVAHLNQSKCDTIQLEGRTCDLGDADYNYDLGLRRANAVRAALIKYGVAPARISVRSWGESKPDFPNTNKENRRKNRSVRLQVGCM